MPISTLKIYLHDGTASFRIQLVGEMKDTDLSELKGCWRTAQSSIEGRPLVVDVSKLKSAEGSGQEWLAAMARDGARILDGRQLTDTPPARFIKPLNALTQESGQPAGSDQSPAGRLRSFISHIQRSRPEPKSVKTSRPEQSHVQRNATVGPAQAK